ncbi:MAG: type 1 glutamine amidotransferase [Saprospiraceae bacterium]
MKALILQMRGAEDSSREVEQQEYLAYSGLDSSQVDFVDLYEQPDLDPAIVLEYDILFVGGISRDLPTELTWPEERFPFIHRLKDLLQLAIDHKVPSLLSCGGFVIAADFLGTPLYYQLKDFEIGVYRLKKTAAAQHDLLLAEVSDNLPMVVGHVKYCKTIPPNAELLLYTNSYGTQIPVHAFKLKNAPFYAFQGHPEISCADLAGRVKPMLYRQHYFPPRDKHPEDQKLGYNETAYEAFCALETDTQEAQNLLRRFVDLVAQGAFKR